MEQLHNIALFIDGDNVNKTTFQENFDEIKLKGRICIKRIYFDFTEKMDDKWKSIILNNGIDFKLNIQKTLICDRGLSYHCS